MKAPALLRRLSWKVSVRLDPVSALGELFEAYADSLFRYAVTLTASRAAAEDAVQDVFLALSRDPGRLRTIDDPQPYLYRAVRNQALKVTGPSWAELPEVELFPSPGLAPDERACLLEALQQLPAEQREILFLKEVLGLSFREVGQILEIPLHTAASRHRYGLVKLREQLEVPALNVC